MDDAELLQRFEAASVPHEMWTHRAHVRVAWIYVRQYSFEAALAKMRVGVQRLNAANGVEEGPTSGYNETTTHAFLHLIAATHAAHAKTFPCDSSDAFCDTHPQLMTRHVLRLFYSPQLRMDPRAKAEFLPPDLSPLPRINDQ